MKTNFRIHYYKVIRRKWVLTQNKNEPIKLQQGSFF